jgi:hypothetical protein
VVRPRDSVGPAGAAAVVAGAVVAVVAGVAGVGGGGGGGAGQGALYVMPDSDSVWGYAATASDGNGLVSISYEQTSPALTGLARPTAVDTLTPAAAPRLRLTGPSAPGRPVGLAPGDGTARQGWVLSDRRPGRSAAITNRATGLCLDVHAGPGVPRATLVTAVCHRRSAGQQWVQMPDGHGGRQLVSELTGEVIAVSPSRRTAVLRGDRGGGAEWAAHRTGSSYTLRSATVSVRWDPQKRPTMIGLCGEGYHVTGTYTRLSTGTWVFDPEARAHGDSIFIPSSSAQQPTGTTDALGRLRYRGLKVTLANSNPFRDRDGYFTWTCAAD